MAPLLCGCETSAQGGSRLYAAVPSYLMSVLKDSPKEHRADFNSG